MNIHSHTHTYVIHAHLHTYIHTFIMMYPVTNIYLLRVGTTVKVVGKLKALVRVIEFGVTPEELLDKTMMVGVSRVAS